VLVIPLAPLFTLLLSIRSLITIHANNYEVGDLSPKGRND
jgi:hypothetical protein